MIGSAFYLDNLTQVVMIQPQRYIAGDKMESSIVNAHPWYFAGNILASSIICDHIERIAAFYGARNDDCGIGIKTRHKSF